MNTNYKFTNARFSKQGLMTVLLVGVATLLLAACDKQASSSAGGNPSGSQSRPKVEFASALNGGRLFQENCVQCHGSGAEGASQWQQPGVDGKYPAPPLNGSGHTWHHPKKGLVRTIKYGTLSMGGSMPAWQVKLSDKDIDDIIAWFQSHWSDEIYREWQKRDQG